MAIVTTNRSGDLLSRIGPSVIDKINIGDDVMLFIRPESLNISDQLNNSNFCIKALVTNEEFEGQLYNVFLEGNEGKQIKMCLVNQGKVRESSAGKDMFLEYDPEQSIILPTGELASE